MLNETTVLEDLIQVERLRVIGDSEGKPEVGLELEDFEAHLSEEMASAPEGGAAAGRPALMLYPSVSSLDHLFATVGLDRMLLSVFSSLYLSHISPISVQFPVLFFLLCN